MAHDASTILRALSRVRARARGLLLLRRLGMLLAVALPAIVGFALLDYLVRFPAAFRSVVLLAGLSVFVIAWWRLIVPAIRFAPSLTTIALRVESISPRLAGILAAAVDFEQSKGTTGRAPSPTEAALAQRVIDDASKLFASDAAARVLKPKSAMTGAGLGAAGLLAVLVPLLLVPTMWAIGAERVLWPWGGAAWPKRTGIVDATTAEVHPLGVALPLRAALTRSPRPADETDVAVRVRRIVDGQTIETRRLLLAHQGREVPGMRGELFERLIEPSGDAVEYRFETSDDETAWRRVRLVPQPAIVRARATITPPDYVRDIAETLNQSASEPSGAPPTGPQIADTQTITTERSLADELSLDMGPGMDERAIAPQALIGAGVRLELTLNKEASIVNWPDLLAADPGIATDSIALDDAGDIVVLSFRLEGPARIVAALIDEHGIASADDAVYRFSAIADRPPTATIIDPPRDRTALPAALIDTTAEARDDVSLGALWLEHQRFVPAGREGGEPSGPGGAVEPLADPVRVAERTVIGQSIARTEQRLDLAELELNPGDELHLTTFATDIFAAPDGTTRDAVRSTTRIIRIIDEAAFIDEIRSALTDVRETAIRMEADQRELREGLDRPGAEADRTTMREQARMTQRAARQEQALADLQRRIEENRLEDAQLRDLLAESRDALQEAGRSSARASEALDQAAAEAARRLDEAGEDPAAQDEAAQLNAEERAKIQQAQDETEAELQRLIQTLDTGQDTWVVRNTLERLAREQRALETRTESLNNRTAGLTPEELAPDDRSELERIVEAQDALAERTRELLKEIEERAEALEQADPQSAQALREAAQRGEEQQVAQQMEAAAQQAQENQLTQAGQQQQQAAEALENMLRDLEGSEEQRAEVLRRVLRSVIESLDRLIADQQQELADLEAAEADGDLGGLDTDMIALFRNTLAVVDVVRAAGPELAAVAALVGRASDAQSQAVSSLRSEGELAEIAEATRGHEQRALDLLLEARRRAQELDQQIEQQQQERQRDELRRAYRAALEEQILIRAAAGEFAAAEQLNRRDRIEVRQLGERQTALRDEMKRVLVDVVDMADAEVFEFTHERLDVVMEQAEAALGEVEPGEALSPQDRSIAMLRGLVRALDQSRPDSEFDDQEGGGGGSGSGEQGEQPLIPPIAQLRMLRELQADLRSETSDAADASMAGQRPTQIERLAREQRRLNELALKLIEQAQQQQGGGMSPQRPAPPDPGDPGAEQPQEEQDGPVDDSSLQPPDTGAWLVPMGAGSKQAANWEGGR